MNSFRIFNRRAGSVFAVAALVVTTAIPGLVSAATVTERSIALSDSTKNVGSVKYTVNFTTVASSTGAFVVDFCTTAAVGTACTTPAGFSTNGVSINGGHTVTTTNSDKGVKVELAAPVSADTDVSVELSGIHNPTNSGVMYARIVSYTDATDPGSSGNFNYIDPDTLGAHLDEGGVALTITDGFSVNGAVLETLVFCASGSASAIGSGCSTNVTAPNLTLGTNGILDTTPSEGTIKTQVSTNAAGGAVISLKNSTPGGGLKRAEAASSDITPFYNSGTPAASIGNNSAKFGLKLGNLSGGTVASGSYTTSGFFLDYLANNSVGVTSAYGSPIYNTGGAPISDGTADLTFAANISNLTPAGNYSASLNLIATGKF